MSLKHLGLIGAATMLASATFAQDYLPILQYHHVSASTPRSTSLSPEEFKEHMDYLAEANFNVVDLAKALDDIRNGVALPDKAVAITFDDAYRNIYQNGFPILKEHGFPFTVFINTQPIEQKNRSFLTWDQIKEMTQSGGVFANHTVSHPYMARMEEGESHGQWKARMEKEVADVEAALEEHLGTSPKMLAYPYGESNQEIRTLLTDQGIVGFGQQSGVVSKDSNFADLPRFPAAGNYAKLSTLKTKLNSMPMPLEKVEAGGDFAGEMPVSLTLSFKDGQYRLKDLACYVSGQGKAALNWLDDTTVVAAAEKPFGVGRGRINCTMPNRAGSQYYWFSNVWIRAGEDQRYVSQKN
ncbi:polysaccharide deacetylase family protein [Rhodanobacter aciditrophus]|uniref:Polysaccharide deacetylase family protein n=1 Tax=Rhodanobacter aciditrophus TaxID=1623218 RepID=A0ABW4AV89_9GAMM